MRHLTIHNMFAACILLLFCTTSAIAQTDTSYCAKGSDSSIPFSAFGVPLPNHSKARSNISQPMLDGVATGTDLIEDWYTVWPDGPDAEGLSSFEMLVSGTDSDGNPVAETIVSQRTFSGSPKVWYWRLKARIDTTHFQNGSTLTVRLHSTDFSADTISTDGYARYKVLNRAMALENNTLDAPQDGSYHAWANSPTAAQTVDDAATFFRASGLGVYRSSTASRSDIIALLPNYTDFFMDTHSNTQSTSQSFGLGPLKLIQYFGDCNNTPYGNPDSPIQPYQTYTLQATAVARILTQAGARPSNVRFYNYVFLHGCYSAGRSDSSPLVSPAPLLANAFLNGSADASIEKYPEDTAYQGWSNETVEDTDSAVYVGALFSGLADGEPLIEANDYAESSSLPTAGSLPKILGFISQKAHPVIIGDNYMTLHGVYRGSGLSDTDLLLGRSELEWYLETYNGPK